MLSHRFNADRLNCVIITAGASAALQLACQALIEAGDEVTDARRATCRHSSARQTGVPATTADERFQLTTGWQGKTAWGPKTRGVLLYPLPAQEHRLRLKVAAHPP
jgi:hypothetical protein